MKDGLSNVAGGFTMLFTKPFTAGDEIEIGDTAGIVDHIDLLTTQLHTYDNKVVIIPNGTVTTSVIINTTKRDIRRVNVEFSIADKRQSERTMSASVPSIRLLSMNRLFCASVIPISVPGMTTAVMQSCGKKPCG